MSKIPGDRRYLESHGWITAEGGAVEIGTSDLAQGELGDVAFVEPPAEGDEFAADEEFGVVESIKAVPDPYTPTSGTATVVNEGLLGAPKLLNDDPYGDGWTLAVEPTGTSEFDGLLSLREYREQTE